MHSSEGTCFHQPAKEETLDEKETAHAEELADEQLGEVSGGKIRPGDIHYEKDGHIYYYSGESLNVAFRCQRCDKPVRHVADDEPQDLVFHCDRCDMDFTPAKLNRYLEMGYWMRTG